MCTRASNALGSQTLGSVWLGQARGRPLSALPWLPESCAPWVHFRALEGLPHRAARPRVCEPGSCASLGQTENGRALIRYGQDSVCAILVNPLPNLPLPSSARLTSLPGRMLRTGPDGQGLRGAPGSLGWGRDRHQTSENPLSEDSLPNPLVPFPRESCGRDPRGGSHSYSTLCSQGCRGHRVACACVWVCAHQRWEL